LFLRKANLARDLTAHLRSKIKDPGERVLRGGVGIGSTRGKKSIPSGIELKDAKPLQKPTEGGSSSDAKLPDTESGRRAGELVKATGARQAELLEQMKNEKGSVQTEALATAIPYLDGESHRKAREALAERLTRMKDETLTGYLQDDDVEIRRAAALAIGMKESKSLVPNLIPMLRDPEITVARAAHAALKALTGQDFGPASKATREERDQAVIKWLQWWGQQRKKAVKE
jgi:HEAT repeat protein